MKLPEVTAKLDYYNPEIIERLDCTVFILRFEKMTSPEIADVSSEITASKGYIFASGHYYLMTDLSSTNDIENDIYRMILITQKIK